jgi:simple sugar transport system permease protein
MSNTAQIQPVAPPETARRERRRSLLRVLLSRPEGGALVAALAIFAAFYAIAPPFRSLNALTTILYDSSTLGIMAVGVALLMIGGEFDLSTGVAVITAGLTAAMVSYQLSLNLWVGAIFALALALTIGFINGYLVIKTGIPSFLVTLSMFFMLQGLNLGVTKIVTNTVSTPNISNMDGFGALRAIFASSFTIGGLTVRITVVWWLLFVAFATWLLLRSRVGNWIFAVGGNAASARAVGVPVAKVKIGLFMTVGFLAWFYGMHRLYAFSTVQSGEGVGNELLYIVAVVVGGCLLTGGYGSAIGAAIGAFIFGMTRQGIVYAGWDPNWYRFFLGLMLLLAVALNIYIKRRSTGR